MCLHAVHPNVFASSPFQCVCVHCVKSPPDVSACSPYQCVCVQSLPIMCLRAVPTYNVSACSLIQNESRLQDKLPASALVETGGWENMDRTAAPRYAVYMSNICGAVG